MYVDAQAKQRDALHGVVGSLNGRDDEDDGEDVNQLTEMDAEEVVRQEFYHLLEQEFNLEEVNCDVKDVNCDATVDAIHWRDVAFLLMVELWKWVKLTSALNYEIATCLSIKLLYS
jgi:hypothetical protein